MSRALRLSIIVALGALVLALFVWVPARAPESPVMAKEKTPPTAPRAAASPSAALSGASDQDVLAALRATARTDPDRALAEARERVVNRTQAEFYSSFFGELAARDLSSAVAKLAQVPPGAGRENALRAIADVWARTDFAAALAWSQKLAAADRAPALETLLIARLADEPLEAIQLAQHNLAGPALDRVVALALAKLIPGDPAAAAKIIAVLPVGETRTLAAADVARRLVAQNPADTLAWIATLADPPTERIALNAALEAWAAVDSTAPARYVAAMPPGRAQDSAAAQMGRVLGARDPVQAVAWASTLPLGSVRSAAVIALGSAWAQHDAAPAVAWAATLPAGPVQTETLRGAMSYWLLKDAAAARAWLTTANIAPELKAALLKPAP